MNWIREREVSDQVMEKMKRTKVDLHFLRSIIGRKCPSRPLFPDHYHKALCNSA